MFTRLRPLPSSNYKLTCYKEAQTALRTIKNSKKSNGNNPQNENKMTKTMKYLSMAAFVLSGAMIMGCTRENQPENLSENQPEPPSENVVTLSTTIGLEGSSATRALTEHGVKTFAEGEKIAVVYETITGYSKVDVSLAADDISNSGNSATITVTLSDPKTNGFVKYIYPADMAKDNGDGNFDKLYNEQDGTLSKIASTFDYARFDGNFDDTELPHGTLRNQLALCKFTIKDGESNDITSSLTKLTIKNGTDVYHINTSSQSKIWVALKPISSGDIDIYAAKGKELYRKTVTRNTTLAVNTLTPITVTAPIVPGALSGLFSVNASHDLVYFSQGNLQAEWKWDSSISNYSWDHFNFATNQYDFIGDTSGNTGLDNPIMPYKVDLFGWSTNNGANYFGINSSTAKAYYDADFYDWGIANIQNGGGRNKWRTPGYGELNYLNFTRSASTVKGASNARFAKVMIQNPLVYGFILFPDNYIHPSLLSDPFTEEGINNCHNNAVSLLAYDWNKMEAAGAVFLPAGGYRDGTTVTLKLYVTEYGDYWTSTKTTNQGSFNDSYAIMLNFGRDSKSDFFDFYNFPRYNGCSVRLIGPR